MTLKAFPPAPQLDDLAQEFELAKLLRLRPRDGVTDGLSVGPYLHWEQLRHRPLPEGLSSHRQWWALAKLRRSAAARELPLTDATGRPFRFCLTDSLQRRLSEIDRRGAGTIGAPERVLNEDTKTQYLVDSWILEAITSSQLEGAATTHQVAAELLRSGRAPVDHDERMIFNNYRAVRHIREIQTLTPESVQQLHRVVTEGTLERTEDAGRLQTPEEERVVVRDNRSGEVLHRPPPAALLPARLAEMCAFGNSEGPAYYLHPVLRAAVLHFWMSYDHPFVDGNGRTARSLYYYSVAKAGYWLLEYVAISPFLKNAPAKYGEAFLFTESDDNDLTYFLEYHVETICRGIDALEQEVRDRSAYIQGIEDRLRSEGDLNHRQLSLLSHALRHPRSRYSNQTHQRSHQVAYATARADLLDLVSRGLLDEKRGPGKQKLFVASDTLQQLLRDIRSA